MKQSINYYKVYLLYIPLTIYARLRFHATLIADELQKLRLTK